MNLVGLLDSTARKNPHRDCIRYQGKGFTYEDILQAAEKAAGLFQSWGLKKNDKVAIMSLNTPSFVIAFYGALKAGGVIVPVNHKLMAPEVDYILEHSETKIFLFDGALKDVAAKLTGATRKVAMDSPVDGFALLESLLETAPVFQPVAISDEDLAE
ncbi:MAG TPA: AMP-binding protein, partial [Syntrophales bacterium]